MSSKKTGTKRQQSAKKRAKAPRKTSSNAKKQKSLKLLEKIMGIGQGLWNEDAQEYVNSLR